jgi:hypothetical protein
MAHNKLGMALRRNERFERELAESDQAMRAQLLSAWKETIFEEFVAALKSTDELQSLGHLDRNIAVVLDLAAYKSELEVFTSGKESPAVSAEVIRRGKEFLSKRKR